MITDIKIQDENYSLEGEKKLSGLSKINIFVGSNNSGKSRFLRSIFTNELLFLNKNYFLIKENILKLNEFVNQGYRSRLVDGIKLSLGEFLTESNDYKGELNSFESRISNASEGTSIAGKTFKELGKEINDYIDKNLDFSLVKNYNYKKVYIPMLRGLRGFEEYTREDIVNVYDLRTQKDYFKDKEGFEIFTGLTLYEDIKEMLLGSLEDRKMIKEFERFLSDNFFEGDDITLIPRTKDENGEKNDVLFIKIGKQEERPIYNLGDGLQTIIINTFPLFKYKGEDLLLFIEEPEMTIHPGMQRRLIEVFSQEQFKNVQYFITTHSNHLLDISLDFNNNISTYSVKKESDEKYIINNKTKNKDILDVLGIRNSSVFLSNCIIWVEGISDRLYIKKFLELYFKSSTFSGKKYEEDKHYSILEYGGGNITHFNFDEADGNDDTINIESIQKNNFMVADNDGNWDGKRIKDNEKGKRLEKLEEIFGENIFYKHREIENILGLELFKKYGEKFLNNEENKKEIKYDLRNEENIDWANGKIGEILKDHFISPKNGDGPGYYKNNTDIQIIGQNKANFARDIIKIIEKDNIQFDDLDAIVKEMIIKIYDFIEENNI